MEPNEELILNAAETGDSIAIQKLLNEDRNLVNARGFESDTPLHIAAWQKHPIVVQQLLIAGADINARGCYQRTPLHYAVHEGTEMSCIIVGMLIERGADKSLKDENGNTPEQWARIEMYEGLSSVLEALEHGKVI